MAHVPSVARGMIFNGILSVLKYSMWTHLKTEDKCLELRKTLDGHHLERVSCHPQLLDIPIWSFHLFKECCICSSLALGQLMQVNTFSHIWKLFKFHGEVNTCIFRNLWEATSNKIYTWYWTNNQGVSKTRVALIEYLLWSVLN